MGYLNNDTIIVDAILTKRGRHLLSLGQGLNISKFALSDDGIDYELFNPDHPSGSAKFSSAITSIPQLEATPSNFTTMNYKLSTLDRNVKYLPYIELNNQISEINFGREDQGKSQDLIPKTYNFSQGTENYEFFISNTSILSVSGGTFKDMSGNIGVASAARDIPQSAVVIGNQLQISPLANSGNPQQVLIRITGLSSASVLTVKVTVDNNVLR